METYDLLKKSLRNEVRYEDRFNKAGHKRTFLGVLEHVLRNLRHPVRAYREFGRKPDYQSIARPFVEELKAWLNSDKKHLGTFDVRLPGSARNVDDITLVFKNDKGETLFSYNNSSGYTPAEELGALLKNGLGVDGVLDALKRSTSYIKQTAPQKAFGLEDVISKVESTYKELYPSCIEKIFNESVKDLSKESSLLNRKEFETLVALRMGQKLSETNINSWRLFQQELHSFCEKNFETEGIASRIIEKREAIKSIGMQNANMNAIDRLYFNKIENEQDIIKNFDNKVAQLFSSSGKNVSDNKLAAQLFTGSDGLIKSGIAVDTALDVITQRAQEFRGVKPEEAAQYRETMSKYIEEAYGRLAQECQLDGHLYENQHTNPNQNIPGKGILVSVYDKGEEMDVCYLKTDGTLETKSFVPSKEEIAEIERDILCTEMHNMDVDRVLGDLKVFAEVMPSTQKETEQSVQRLELSREENTLVEALKGLAKDEDTAKFFDGISEDHATEFTESGTLRQPESQQQQHEVELSI